jgi:hypothetical protein
LAWRGKTDRAQPIGVDRCEIYGDRVNAVLH